MEENSVAVLNEIVPVTPDPSTEQPKRVFIRAKLRHREVISRLLYHNQTVKQIAEELGFSEGGLGKVIRSPLFQIELQKELNIKQTIERNNVLQSVATNGVAKLAEAVTTGKMTFEERDSTGAIIKRTEKVLDGREIIAITHDALDRTGHKPVERSIAASFDLGSMILNAHKNAERGDDEVIDVEVVNEEPQS